MKYSGYIEGYYGKLFSWQQRHAIVDALAERGFNSYLYAPKEDYYHRVGWRETPPKSYSSELQRFITDSQTKGVTVTPAIAPGLSFEFTSEEDKKTLFTRVEQYVQMGAKSLALLMDDIPLALTDESSKKYTNLAEAQLDLLKEIKATFDVTLYFCPTVYTNQLLEDEAAEQYLQHLSTDLPDEVYLYWTGPHTIAPQINEKTCGAVSNLYPGRVIFWDNYYSNDYCPTRLFVGPYEGRDLNYIADHCAGVMINPTGLFHTDQLLLDNLHNWSQQLHTPWESIAEKHGVPSQVIKLLPWFYGPYSPANAETLLELSEDPITFFTEYIVQWHSAMKLEWYPYLHNLFTEVKFLTGKTISGREWYDLRFPPAHAKRLAGDS